MRLRLLILFVAFMSMTLVAQGQRARKSASTQNVYYVVVGSFQSYSEAVSYNNNGPADTTCGNVYKTTVNGKTLYRVCDGCFTTKAKAQRRVMEIKSFYKEFRDITPWIWTNRGQAKCVEQGVGNDGTSFSTRPR